MRQKTMRLVFWGVLAVVSSSLLVMAGVWVGEQTGSNGRNRNQAERAENGGDSEFENALLGTLAEAVGEAHDAEGDDFDKPRDEAMKTLREADPALSRIRRENREAMRRANQHPRIVPPKRKKKTAAPLKTPKSDSPGNSDQPAKSKSD